MSAVTTTLVGIILTSLVLITVVGNVLVCLSVMLVRKLRKPQNYLLVSLAVSDLFVSLFVMPFAIVFELNGYKWPLSDGLCDLYVSADVLSCTASILNLCAISVDRHQAITRPLEYSGSSSPRKMLAVIFGVWLGAACVSLPPVLLLGNEHENHNCAVSQNFWYQIYATMASFYVPLCVMLVVYAKILGVVADKKKQMTWTNTSRNSSVDRSSTLHVDMNTLHDKFRPMRLKDHKASTTLGIIMSAFIICWLPFFVLAIIRPFVEVINEPPIIPGWISALFLWLGYFNSSLNPVIYATTNRDFRRPFREILCFRCSTLDVLMRREFYEHQFGADEYCVRNKAKFNLQNVVSTKKAKLAAAADSTCAPLSPLSESNVLNKVNNPNSADSEPQSRASSPLPPPPPTPPPPPLEFQDDNDDEGHSPTPASNNSTPSKNRDQNQNQNQCSNNTNPSTPSTNISPNLSPNCTRLEGQPRHQRDSYWSSRNNVVNRTLETRLIVDSETEKEEMRLDNRENEGATTQLTS